MVAILFGMPGASLWSLSRGDLLAEFTRIPLDATAIIDPATLKAQAAPTALHRRL